MQRQRTRARLGVALGLAFVCSGCERDPTLDASAGSGVAVASAPSLDLGAARASAVDGLELAAADPGIAQGLGLAAQLEHPALQAALERLLAQVAADPQLARASEDWFAHLQDSPAMRAALVDYARENPELDAAALAAGFVSYVDARLTRPELATVLERKLRSELRGADPALARAWVVDAGGASAIAAGVLARLEDPRFEPALRERLGRDPAAVQARLERRLADPARAGPLLLGMQAELASEPGVTALVEIVALERSAELLAAALARGLADEQLRERTELLFALALASSFDEAAFAGALERLLAEAVVAREAAALVSAIAREPAVRARVEQLCAQYTAQPSFEQRLLAALE